MKQHVACVVLGLATIFSTATLSSAALVGASPSFPVIAYQNTAITALSYTPGTQVFAIDARPTAVLFSSSEAPRVISPVNSGLRIRVLVNSSGALVGGVPGADLTISGTVTRVVGTVTNTYSGILLTGEVTAFGFEETGVNDQYDFRFTPTGGALLSFYSCGTVGVTVASELSTFTGTFLLPFTGRANGNVGLEDLTPPVVTCPDTIVVECNAGGAFVSFPAPSAIDNCDTNITFVYSPPSGSFFPLDEGDMTTNHTATLTATDSSGNQSSCSFTITVQDLEEPLFDDNENPLIEPCAIDQLTFSNDLGQCYATVTLIKPTASDCCAASVNVTVSAVDEHNVVIPLTDLGNGMFQGQFPVSHDGGTNWVTVVADDGHGNTSQSRCPVIVVDNELPVITCPPNVTVTTLPPADFADGSAIDNCGSVTVTHVSDSSVTTDCTITVTRTYKATDRSGNSATCAQTITVAPTINPTDCIIWHAPLARSPANHDTDPSLGMTFKYPLKHGSTIPVQVHVNGCTTADVTSNPNVIGEVNLYADQNCDAAADGIELPIDFNGVGGSGGMMENINGHLKYNLDTKSLTTAGCHILEVVVTDVSTGQSCKERLWLQKR